MESRIRGNPAPRQRGTVPCAHGEQFQGSRVARNPKDRAVHAWRARTVRYRISQARMRELRLKYDVSFLPILIIVEALLLDFGSVIACDCFISTAR